MSLLQSLGDLGVRGPSAQVLKYASRGWNWLKYRFADSPWSRRRRVVLAPYTPPLGPKSLMVSALAVGVLGMFCLAYGFFYGLTAPYLNGPFLAPIGLLSLFVVWALPDLRRAPTYGIELLFPATIIGLLLWPDYVAISLPGLPWITILRLMNFPLAGLLLVSLSVSEPLRRELASVMGATRPMWTFLGGFIAVQVATIALSSHPVTSVQSVVLFQISCTCAMLVAALLFRDGRFVERYFTLLCAIGVPLAALAFYEASRERVPWAGHIPSFLRIQDPAVQRMLSAVFRQWIEAYRVKATFKTPLAFAEYLSLLTPFLLYFATTPRKVVWRFAAALLVPLNFVVIRLTDSRLGVVGMLVSLLLYGLLWTIMRWRSRPRDLLAAAIVYAYPVLFCGAIGLVFASHRLHAMVMGDGAQASSTEARNAQLAMALPKVLANPLGYGAGNSGLEMGYATGDFITIDNYFISIILDFGILGVIFWYGTFAIGIYYAVRYCFSSKYAHRVEARSLAPLAVGLIAFVIVKWVHAQTDNHIIYFMQLGMIAALIHRLKSTPETPDGLAVVRAQDQRANVRPLVAP